MRRRMSLAATRARTFIRAPLRPRWYWPVVHLSGIAAGLLLGFGTGAWLGWSGTIYGVATDVTHRVLSATGEAGLRVRDVRAVGREHTDKLVLEAQLGVNRGDPILGFDAAAAQARIEQLPWIEKASVGRYLPDTIRVSLVEHRPLALWQHGGVFSLIDREGALIVSDLTGADIGGRFDNLRVLVGENAPAHAVELFRMLSVEPALASRVKAATWIGDRRWTLRLDNQVDVLLPEKASLAAWRFLARTDREQALLDRAVMVIDLREAPHRMRLKLDQAAFGDLRA